jgi:WD40 repeat protein
MDANLNSHASGVSAVWFAPNSLWLLSGHFDGIIVKYAVNSNFAVVRTARPHYQLVRSLSSHADGYDGTVKVYTAGNLKTD